MTDNLTDAHLLNALNQIRSMKSERATLRDQFAMAALKVFVDHHTHRIEYGLMAKHAYAAADAMLAAREQKK